MTEQLVKAEGIFSSHGVDSIVMSYTAERMGLVPKGSYTRVKDFISPQHKHNCIAAMNKLADQEFMKRFENTNCFAEDILMYAVEEIV